MNDTDASGATPAADESALGTVKGLVEEHPVAMLAGGILLGALVAGALKRPAKALPEGKPRRSFARRAAQIATFGAELAAAYVAGAESMAEESPAPAPATAPEAAKPKARRISGLAANALRMFGPVLSRRLGRNKD